MIPTSNAEVINQIIITGNKRISEETIKVYGEIELKKDYSQNDINDILKNLYETNFFEDIKINLNNGTIKIEVIEYPSIYSIDLEGEKSNTIKKEILSKLNLKVRDSFIDSKLSEDVLLIKKLYNYLGYNFVKIDTKTEKIDSNRIKILYLVDRGKKTNISQIKFIGDKKIKEKRLRDVIVSEEYKFWKFLSKNTFLKASNIELDKRLLVNYYKSLGYYDVQVLSNNAEVLNSTQSILIYTINAGDRYKVNKVTLDVAEILDKEQFEPILKDFNEIVGKYYSPFKVKRLLDNLDLLIAQNDLQFIEHSVNEIIENKNIEIKINVYEGDKEIVKKINIYGNTITEEAVIRGELVIDEGDPFSDLKLQQSIARINARNLFGLVDSKITNSDKKNEKIIDIKVEEIPTGEIIAGAGIGTSGGSFAFSIKENNWLGKGLTVSTDLNLSSETFSGGLRLVDPNYNFSGNQISFNIENSTNDKPKSGYKNNITTAGISTRFEQYKDIFLSPGISMSYDDLKVEDSASSALKKQKGTFADLSFNYGVTNDQRDRVYSSTDGHILNFSQIFPLYADSPYIRNSFSGSKYIPFSENYVGAFKFYASTVHGINNKDVRLSKRIYLNATRLRGFEDGKIGPKDGDDYVGGNYATSANFELNLPNILPETTKTDVGLFLDVGNLWSVDYDKTLDDSNKIRSSVGINTSWLSPVGPLSFIFSQNISKANTDVTESFNFRLGTTF